MRLQLAAAGLIAGMAALSLPACKSGGSSGGGAGGEPEFPESPVEAHGDVVAVVEANRTSGVAPLAVFFDATDSRGVSTSRPFHDLEFSWNFGDPGSGRWPTTGLGRNTAMGPVAAHVYEEPGTYRVRLVVRDPDGSGAETSIEIHVDDPDEVFAGASTVCVSQTGDFSSAPAGALAVVTSSFADAMSHATSGRRVLLRRGETWDTPDSITLNVPGPGIIGAYGIGVRPTIRATGNQRLFQFSGRTPRLKDWRIMDLHVDGMGDADTIPFRDAGMVRELLLLRLSVDESSKGYMLSLSVPNWFATHGVSGHSISEDIAIVQCTVGNNFGTGVYVAARRLIFLGNDFAEFSRGGHLTRFPYVHKAVFAHNKLRTAGSARHLVKLHAPGFNDPGLGNHKYSELALISNNIFAAGDVESWGVVLGPQNGDSDERLRDIIVERNHFTAGPTTNVALVINASRVTVRNNVFDGTGGRPTFNCIDIGRRGIEPPPVGVRILNNTGYRGDAGSFRLVWISDAAVSRTTIYNNLAAAPEAQSSLLVVGKGSSLDADFNLVTDDPGFVRDDPQDPSDFHLIGDSPAIDAGAVVPSTLLRDYDRAAMPLDGDGSGTSEYDLGAFEFRG